MAGPILFSGARGGFQRMRGGYGMRGPRPGYMGDGRGMRGPPFQPRPFYPSPYPGMPPMGMPPMAHQMPVQQTPQQQAERLKKVAFTYCSVIACNRSQLSCKDSFKVYQSLNLINGKQRKF